MALATTRMPKLKSGNLIMTPSWSTGPSDEAYLELDIECRSASGGGKEWELRIGHDIELPKLPELVKFLESAVGREGSVLAHSEGRERPVIGWYQFSGPF